VSAAGNERPIAVGVSGAGSNLRALAPRRPRRARRRDRLVFADRDCPALAWAAEQGIETALLPGLAAATGERAGADEALASTLDGGDRLSWPRRLHADRRAAVLAAFPAGS
jgi:folate-dependent phosphoribosylglycinamide formyltransferase PurN